MKFNYDIETDSLYIHLKDSPGVDSNEITQDFILDYDSRGEVVGIEILSVKNKIDLNKIIFSQVPFKDISFINQKDYNYV